MGNTIRREPLSFKIPDTPDYKFFNITDFGGLDITDNPFTAKTNTASDALNVYVDENNALTTRPRLEKFYDFELNGIIPNNANLISVNYIDSKYLLQYSVNNIVQLKWFNNPGTTTINKSSTTALGTNIIKPIKFNGDYYFLDGISYKVIHNNNVYDVSQRAYVPTTKIGKIPNSEFSGESFESPNILSNYYNESYGASVENRLEVDYTFALNKETTLKAESGDSVTLTPTDVSAVKYQLMNYIPIKNDDDTSVVSSSKDDSLIVTISEKSVHLINPNTNEVILSHALPSLNYDYGLAVDYTGDKIVAFHSVSDDGVSYDYTEDGGDTWQSHDGGEHLGLVRQTETAFSDDLSKIYLCSGGIVWFTVNGGTSWTKNTQITYSGEIDTMEHISCSSDGSKCIITYNEYPYTNNAQTIFTVNNGTNWTKLTTILTKNANKIVSSVVGTDDNFYVVLDDNSVYKYNTTTQTWSYVSTLTRYTVDGYRFKLVKLPNLQFILFRTNGTNLVYTLYDSEFQHIGYVGRTIHGVQTSLSSVYSSNNGLYGIMGNVVLSNNSFVKNEDYIVVKNQYSESNKYLNKINSSLFHVFFQNHLWLGGKDNFVCYSGINKDTGLNDLSYFPEKSISFLGNDTNIVSGFNISTDNKLIVYTKTGLGIITYEQIANDTYDYTYTETKTNQGHLVVGETIVTPLTNVPLQYNKTGFFAYQSIKNILTDEKSTVLYSSKISKKLDDETTEKIFFMKHKYWCIFFFVYEKHTNVYVLDDRNSSWYFWKFDRPFVYGYEVDDVVKLYSSDGVLYELKTSDIVTQYSTEYYDDGKSLIEWKWVSQILPLGTINYAKRLINTTFIVTDTDANEDYGLVYSFKIYRRTASETKETDISGVLNYIRSITKKTTISRFNFLQLELSNLLDDYNNNKLRLTGLGLKYVLMEALY